MKWHGLNCITRKHIKDRGIYFIKNKGLGGEYIMNYITEILTNLANDDTIERNYLEVGWRDILLDYVKEIRNDGGY